MKGTHMRYFALAVSTVVLLTWPALADTVATIAAAPPGDPSTTTIVSIPVGSYLNTALGYLTVALGGVIVWGLRLLPPQLYAMAMVMRADQLLARAIGFGINAVAGATDGKMLNFDVRNTALREMITYVLLHGADAVKQYMGTPAQIGEMIWSRLDLPQEASRPNFDAIGAQAQAQATTKELKT